MAAVEQAQGEGTRRFPEWKKIRSWRPGLISGISDNDPTTIATLAIVGASTRFDLAWVLLLLVPMLGSVQYTSARLGAVTCEGLQLSARERYGKISLLLLVAVLAVAIVTMAADIEAGAAGLSLLMPLPWRVFVLPFASLVLGLLWFGSYERVRQVLSFVLFVFLVYVVAAFLAEPPWGDVLRHSFVPNLDFDDAHIEGILALLGTTLTAYVYVWQSIEGASAGCGSPARKGVEQSAVVGVVAAIALFWFILVTTGATLGANNVHVQTAQDAARALGPAAGGMAEIFFAFGLVAAAALALPVLGASAAYVLADEAGWRTGLSERPGEARGFYLVLTASVALAALTSLLPIAPIRLLFVASIAGGLGTPISLAFLLRSAADRELMGDLVLGKVALVIGWLTVAVVSTVSLVFLATAVFREV